MATSVGHLTYTARHGDGNANDATNHGSHV